MTENPPEPPAEGFSTSATHPPPPPATAPLWLKKRHKHYRGPIDIDEVSVASYVSEAFSETDGSINEHNNPSTKQQQQKHHQQQNQQIHLVLKKQHRSPIKQHQGAAAAAVVSDDEEGVCSDRTLRTSCVHGGTAARGDWSIIAPLLYNDDGSIGSEEEDVYTDGSINEHNNPLTKQQQQKHQQHLGSKKHQSPIKQQQGAAAAVVSDDEELVYSDRTPPTSCVHGGIAARGDWSIITPLLYNDDGSISSEEEDLYIPTNTMAQKNKSVPQNHMDDDEDFSDLYFDLGDAADGQNNNSDGKSFSSLDHAQNTILDYYDDDVSSINTADLMKQRKEDGTEDNNEEQKPEQEPEEEKKQDNDEEQKEKEQQEQQEKQLKEEELEKQEQERILIYRNHYLRFSLKNLKQGQEPGQQAEEEQQQQQQQQEQQQGDEPMIVAPSKSKHEEQQQDIQKQEDTPKPSLLTAVPKEIQQPTKHDGREDDNDASKSSPSADSSSVSFLDGGEQNNNEEVELLKQELRTLRAREDENRNTIQTLQARLVEQTRQRDEEAKPEAQVLQGAVISLDEEKEFNSYQQENEKLTQQVQDLALQLQKKDEDFYSDKKKQEQESHLLNQRVQELTLQLQSIKDINNEKNEDDNNDNNDNNDKEDNNADPDKHKEENEKLNMEIRELALKLKKNETRLHRKNQDYELIDAEVVELRSQLTNTQVVVQDLEQERLFGRAKIAELSELLETSQQSNVVGSRKDDHEECSLEQQLLAKAGKVAQLSAEIDSMKIQLEEKTSRIEQLELEHEGNSSLVKELSSMVVSSSSPSSRQQQQHPPAAADNGKDGDDDDEMITNNKDILSMDISHVAEPTTALLGHILTASREHSQRLLNERNASTEKAMKLSIQLAETRALVDELIERLKEQDLIIQQRSADLVSRCGHSSKKIGPSLLAAAFRQTTAKQQA